MPLTIEKLNDTTFKATVTGRTTTTHTVTLTPDYWQKLTGGILLIFQSGQQQELW